MSTGATLLADVRFADGRNADLRMAEGVIDAIGPSLDPTGACVIEGGGLLALPGMIDGHVHLDKTLTGLPWMPCPGPVIPPYELMRRGDACVAPAGWPARSRALQASRRA